MSEVGNEMPEVGADGTLSFELAEAEVAAAESAEEEAEEEIEDIVDEVDEDMFVAQEEVAAAEADADNEESEDPSEA
jgi:hypothetical protein